MSYSIYLEAAACPTCGQKPEEPDCPDPTYNLTSIFDLALTGEPMPNPYVPEVEVVLFRKVTDRPRGLRLLNGKKAGETVGVLLAALGRLTDPGMREQFEALKPPNGWGDLDGATRVVSNLARLATEYQGHVWKVH